MIAVVPVTRGESVFSQVVSLDGVDYIIRFRWNARTSRWFVRLEDTDGTVLLGDRKLVGGHHPMLAHYGGGELPCGELWSVTTSGEDAGLFDLGDDADLVYVSEDSLA